MSRSMSRINDAADSSDATDRLKGKVEDLGQSIRDVAGAAKDAGREQVERVGERAAEVYREGRERVVSFEQTIEEYVRDQPLKSVLIAAGVGLFLGRFWLKR